MSQMREQLTSQLGLRCLAPPGLPWHGRAPLGGRWADPRAPGSPSTLQAVPGSRGSPTCGSASALDPA